LRENVQNATPRIKTLIIAPHVQIQFLLKH